jgi:tetrahydromethanopterin S-methyltransferase subunit A
LQNTPIVFEEAPVHLENLKLVKARPTEYPVERGNYILGSELSPVAVVVPRGRQDLLTAAVESGAAIAGHLVTANIGIEKLIVNVVSNPNIRFLILYGEESQGHASAQSLLALHKNGIDSSNRIAGSVGMTPYLRNIPKEAIERFREQILYVVDILGEQDENVLRRIVRACIQEPSNAVRLTAKGQSYILYDPGAIGKQPIIIHLTEKLKAAGLYEVLSPFSTSINAPTISAAYSLLVEAILSAGRQVDDERGFTTRELLNVQVHITNPEQDKVPAGYRPEGWIKSDQETKEYLEKYAQCYLEPGKMVVEYDKGSIKLVEKTNIVYTYGSRLTNFTDAGRHGINQLRILGQAIKRAIDQGHNSRRFVISLVDPSQDLSSDTEKVEIPCFTQFYVYNRRNESGEWSLHGTMFLRSHDAHTAFPANSYAGVRILEELASRSKSKVGMLTMFFGSAHVYNV